MFGEPGTQLGPSARRGIIKRYTAALKLIVQIKLNLLSFVAARPPLAQGPRGRPKREPG